MNYLPEGLDQRFLDFIGVTEESERAVHAFYLRFFRPSQQVLDLGCGAGYFVKMLREQGVEAYGVDQDPVAIEKAQAQGLPIIQAEALDYLQGLPDERLDAIFSAHLVEHLEVEVVYRLIQEAYRVLKADGFLLVTTPNVRAPVSHLEMFWLHFDHKRFYHPRLLEFFMRECKFGEVRYGENWDSVNPQPRHFFMRPWRRFKKWSAKLTYLNAFVQRPFEIYVVGYKHSPQTN